MTRILAFCLILVLFSPKIRSQEGKAENFLPVICLTPTEKELYKLINEYRSQKGLPAIKLAVSLSFVARTQAKDQTENFKDGKRCNMHSWSAKGSWSSCCYTPDHKQRNLEGYEMEGNRNWHIWGLC